MKGWKLNLPTLGTEAGVEHGWSELNRTDGYSYGPVDWIMHHAMNWEIARGFKDGLFPEALFCQCYWVLREDRNDSPFKHAGLWNNLVYGGDTPFWAGLERAEAWVRQYAGEEPVPRPAPTRVIDLRGKLMVHPWKRYQRRAYEKIDTWVVHHVGAGDTTLPPHNTARYHVQSLGWPGIGYHYWISGDGSIFLCNDLEAISYQVGVHNPHCVGVCLAGNFYPSGWPTKAQLDSLIWLLAQRTQWAVKGHGELVPNKCPGPWFYEWRQGQIEPPTEDYETMYFRLRAVMAQARELAGIAEGHLSPLQDSLNDMAETIGDLEEVMSDV